MTVYNLKNTNDLNEFISKQPVSVIKVYADWCGPCKSFAPKYKNIAAKYQNSPLVNFAETSSDSKVVKVSALPTTLIVKDGNIVYSMNGGDPKELEKALQSFVR